MACLVVERAPQGNNVELVKSNSATWRPCEVVRRRMTKRMARFSRVTTGSKVTRLPPSSHYGRHKWREVEVQGPKHVSGGGQFNVSMLACSGLLKPSLRRRFQQGIH